LPCFSTHLFDYDDVIGASVFITTCIGDLCHVIHDEKLSLGHICQLLSLLCAMLISSKGLQFDDDKKMTNALHHVMPCLLVKFASGAHIHDGLCLLQRAV